MAKNCTWLVSEMAAYCGGNALRLKQKLQTHNLALKSTYKKVGGINPLVERVINGSVPLETS